MQAQVFCCCFLFSLKFTLFLTPVARNAQETQAKISGVEFICKPPSQEMCFLFQEKYCSYNLVTVLIVITVRNTRPTAHSHVWHSWDGRKVFIYTG